MPCEARFAPAGGGVSLRDRERRNGSALVVERVSARFLCTTIFQNIVFDA
jgi:hypothetical protein